MAKVRNVNLDFTKVVACFAVVGLHVFLYDYNNLVITYLHYFCGYAVPMFFMVNGYLTLNKEQIAYHYVFQKILHVFWVVLLWCILLSMKNALTNHTYPNILMELYGSMMFIDSLSHLWFLWSLILVYLLAPLVHKMINTTKWGYTIVLSLLILVLAFQWLVTILMGHSLTENMPYFLKLWIWEFYFLLGGFLKHHAVFLKTIALSSHGIMTAILIVGFPVYQLAAAKWINYNDYYIDPIAVLTNLVLFTFILKIPMKNEKVNKAVMLLSSLGMGCYLVHPFVIRFLSHFVTISETWLILLFWLLVLVISYFVTWAISKIPYVNRLVKL